MKARKVSNTPEGHLKERMAKAAEYLKLGEASSSKNALPVAKRFTLKEIYELVERANGNTKAICSALDCTRSQWQAYVAKHPDIPELCKQAREALVDKAEQVVTSLLDSSNEAI